MPAPSKDNCHSDFCHQSWFCLCWDFIGSELCPINMCFLKNLSSFAQLNICKIHSCCMNQQFVFLNCWVGFHCLDRPSLIYPFCFWWTVLYLHLGMLWILLIWTFPYKPFCGHTFSFLLGKHLGVGFLSHVYQPGCSWRFTFVLHRR